MQTQKPIKTAIYFKPHEIHDDGIVRTASNYAKFNGFHPVPAFIGWNEERRAWHVDLVPPKPLKETQINSRIA